MKTVSIVIPIFNEELIVEELINRLQRVTHQLSYHFEFCVVDDGSRDKTLEKLLALQNDEPRLKIVKLTRNWGHQNAFNAGLSHARGDALILMDGDLEDPPEMFPEFLKKWEEGFEVVYTVKKSRQLNWWSRPLFIFFYRLLSLFSEVDVEQHSGMFSLIDKKVSDHLIKCNEKNKFYVGLRAFMGYRQVGLPYNREPRFAGLPKQNFRRLVNYAVNAFFSFSFLPIRIITYFGLTILLGIFAFSVALILGRIFDPSIWFFGDLKALPGWTSIVLLLLFIAGTQIVFTGILGEYIARIFDEVRQRPYFIVDEVYEVKKTKLKS
jgi:polyisoprenyl-phosphate glycosyltransferase